MEQEYLIDTNVLIDYMSERLPVKALNFLDSLIDSSFCLSIINKIELLGFRNLSAAEERNFLTLINAAYIIPLHEGIVEETISLRKKYPVKLPDAIIAATAFSINAFLVTNNIKDFSKIEGLKLLNFSKL